MKELIAEQSTDSSHWNIWLIDGESKEHFSQVTAEDSMSKVGMIRSQLTQLKEINLSKAFSELKKIIEWKSNTAIQTNRFKKQLLEDQKQSIGELLEMKAQELLTQFTLRTIEDTKEIFFYKADEGIYLPAQRMLETIIQNDLGEKATRHTVNEVLGRIERSSYIQREKISDKDLIPLKNGIFNVKTQRMIDFSPDYFFTAKHPIDFDPLATCPKINKFLDEICEGDIEKTWLLEKIAAYTFYRGYPIHKAFMMLGGGSNGKSVYLNLLRTMLGDEHVCAVQLQDLAENRFSAANLYRKNANIFADLEAHALKSTGLFKALTGGDFVTCDQKFKASFPFMNTAKLIFSCNQLPETKDESDAFMRRWIIVEFGRQFTGSEINPTLLSEITTPTELSGFFDTLMRRLNEVLKENKFNDESIQETRERYMRNANSVIAFIEEKIEFNSEMEVAKQAVQSAYIAFCNKNNLPKFQGNKLWKSFHDALGDKVWEAHPRKSISGIRERVFKGICLIEEQTKGEKEEDERLSDKILSFLKSKNGGRTQVPLDILYSIDFGEDIITVQDCVKNMKRIGTLYEPVNGFIRINEQYSTISTFVNE